MPAGDLDRRIALQRIPAGRDAFNEPATVPVTIRSVWAKVTPISDGERSRADQSEAVATHRFQIRWSNAVRDFSPKDFVFYEGRLFDVSGVKEIGRRDRLEITATARADT
jgi:SPP1 family predicted phage head-tail adaptor